MSGKAVTGALLALAAAPLWAADADFVGDWDMTLVQGRNVMEGRLQIKRSADGLVAHVEGSPVRLLVTGERIEMSMDDRTATGMPFERYLRGSFGNGAMSGEFGPENGISEQDRTLCEKLPLACPAPTGTWTAVPHEHARTTADSPKPVDLSGNWVMAVGGIRRWTADLTDAGREWQAEFEVETDLPSQRCQSAGLVNGWGFRGNDPEIFQSDAKITIVLGSDVRRIYLDERRPPAYTDWYPLGFSAGHWEGSTLVVATTYLQPAVREWNGEPISENAHVIERYSLDEGGRLVGVMTLHDPENYNEAPIKRARWRRADDTDIKFPSLCDPDSFYRELDDEGLLDEYWERANRRY
jgi:hypothetical protein